MADAERKPLILVVDDETVSVQVLSKIVQSRGYEPLAIQESERCLDMAQKALPDLILLDVSMPLIDGFEICRRLKRDAATREIPVIFISGLDQAADKVNGFRAGGADYITKPFQIEEVSARIEHHLERAALKRATEQHNRELSEANGQLQSALRELQEEHEKLLQSQRKLEIVFTALSDVLPGTVIDGKYRLDERIGRGGFGWVFRATHLLMERRVAMKILQPPGSDNPLASIDFFKREAISACRFDHPNAVTILDASVSSNGLPYLVMELLEGRSLLASMKTHGSFALARAVEVLAPVCDVLAKAHANRLAHRDIKPENIFLSQGENGEVVKVLDFGLSVLQDEAGANVGTEGFVIGSPPYMAPELFTGQPADPRAADIYAMGVTLFEMLAGRTPFLVADQSISGLATAHIHVPPPPLRTLAPEVPEALERIVAASLSKNPADRPSISEFLEALIIASAESDGRGVSGLRSSQASMERTSKIDT